jgi:hypothetical protein
LVKEANEKINAAHEKIQQVATDAHRKIQAANQPEPTVLVSFRKSLFGSGSVATIKNSSSQSISVSLVAERPSTNESRPFSTIIDGGMSKEIGEREGWAFLAGDTLNVSQPNHKSVSYSFK